MAIIWPVFAYEHGDLTLLVDDRDVANTLEAIDVEAQEYELFDSKGGVLTATIDDRSLVQLSEDAAAGSQADKLIGILRRWLHANRLGEQSTDRRPGESEEEHLHRLVQLSMDIETQRPPGPTLSDRLHWIRRLFRTGA